MITISPVFLVLFMYWPATAVGTVVTSLPMATMAACEAASAKARADIAMTLGPYVRASCVATGGAP